MLGWATLLLFGRVGARKQTVLGFVALASLAWVAAAIGILVPDVGTFLVAAVPRPDFVDERLVRLGMLGAVIAIPIAVGVTGVWLQDARSRPSGFPLMKAVLRGYPFTALLAAMIALLGIVAGWRKLVSLAKRWADTHIPLIVKPGAYDAVVTEIADVLARSDLEVRRRPAPAVLLIPARLLDRVAGRTLGSMVPDRLALLMGHDLKIFVYPTDIAISGGRDEVARSRAAITGRLMRAPAWLTVSAEGQAIEDRIEALAKASSAHDRASELAVIDRQLASIVLPSEEWETLYRLRLQVALVGEVEAQDAIPPPPPSDEAEPRLDRLVGVGYSVAVVALLALDVLLLLTGRMTSSRR